ncbi:MAG: gamma-glutamylcyclotransferase [Rhodospirillales bacterium]
MDGTDDFWVFGYGSLMWNPGFAFEEARLALLAGYHRAFCIFSHHYRGTPSEPGLVLGLAPGGFCRGLAFRVAADVADQVRAYLDERELIGYAYLARNLTVVLDGDDDGGCGGEKVTAYTFVADTAHSQYAGNLSIEAAAPIIMGAAGAAGLNRDYLINTVRRLEREGIADPHLHALLRRIEYLTGLIEAGGGI